MENRINIQELEPNAYKAMFGLENYLASTSLDNGLCDLVRLRASQINGCAYCIEMHANEALKRGEKKNRLFAVSAWWESPLFSEKEMNTLEATEEITKISANGLTEKTYQKLKVHFSDNEIAQLIMLICSINIWNRMAVSTRMFHKQ